LQAGQAGERCREAAPLLITSGCQLNQAGQALQGCRCRRIHCHPLQAQRLQAAGAEVGQHIAAELPAAAALRCQLPHADVIWELALRVPAQELINAHVLRKAADATQQQGLGVKPVPRLPGGGGSYKRDAGQVQEPPEGGLRIEDAVPPTANQGNNRQQGKGQQVGAGKAQAEQPAGGTAK